MLKRADVYALFLRHPAVGGNYGSRLPANSNGSVKNTDHSFKLELSTVIVFSVKAHWGKSLTLAGHAYWLITGLAHAVVDGGAAGLGGVLGVRTGQAGTRASWSSLWFIGSRWTCCGGWRRCRFLTLPP